VFPSDLNSEKVVKCFKGLISVSVCSQEVRVRLLPLASTGNEKRVRRALTFDIFNEGSWRTSKWSAFAAIFMTPFLSIV
jgi:hypothetical protein